MRKLLSTAACALVLAAPGWAAAQEVRTDGEQPQAEAAETISPVEAPEDVAEQPTGPPPVEAVREAIEDPEQPPGRVDDPPPAEPRAAQIEAEAAAEVAAEPEQPQSLEAAPEAPTPTQAEVEPDQPPQAVAEPEQPAPTQAEVEPEQPQPPQAVAEPEQPAPTQAETEPEQPQPPQAVAEPEQPAPVQAETEPEQPQPPQAVAEPEQPAPVQAETEPEQPQPPQAVAEPEQPQPGATAERREDGVSPAEFWTGAGLALAPWVLQHILQGQQPPPQQEIVVVPPPQQGQVPYVYDPRTGRYYDQRTGRVVEETTIVERAPQQRAQQQRAPQQRAQQQAAQPAAPQTNVPARPEVLALANWDYEELYRSGWRADQLIGTEVQNQDGRSVGSVRNILIGENNQISGLLVAVDEIGRTGRTVAAVPWDDVRISAGGKAVTVPVTPGTLQRFSMFRTDGGGTGNLLVSAVSWLAPAGGAQETRTWRVTDLLDDYVTLADGRGYGYVDDVVFDPQGRLRAVVVYRDVAMGGGVVAYPFTAYGFEPWAPYYALPYQQNQVADLPAFEPERLD